MADNSAATAFSGWTPQRSAADTLADIHGWLLEHEVAVLNSRS